MIRASLLALFSTLIICGFCGKEFASLGRHSWRCKSKVEYNQEPTANVNPVMEIMAAQECLPVKSCKAIKCCCGKVCKGPRGLKMHQRSCRIIDDLEDELQQQMTEILSDPENEDNIDQLEHENSWINSQEDVPHDLRKGIKLPKSPLPWSSANDFFKLTFSNQPITPHDLNANIKTMVTVIYNYLGKNFGLVDNNKHVEFQRKYASFTAKDLKKVLKKLKLENGDILEIKFVAKELRKLLNKSVWWKTRVCGYAGMRICGYADTRICGYADMRVCGYADMRVCGYADMRVCGYAGIRVCGYAGTSNWFDKQISKTH